MLNEVIMTDSKGKLTAEDSMRLFQRIAELEAAFNTLAVYACRYAHKRHTGSPYQVVRTIIANKDSLTENTRKQLARESSEAVACREDWEQLKAAMEGDK